MNVQHTEEKRELNFIRFADAEFVNPDEKLMNDIIDSYKATKLNTYNFAFKNNKPSPIGKMSMSDILTGLEWQGLALWKNQYERIMKVCLSDEIFQILNCNEKDSQIKIFKTPFELSTLSLQKFIIKAWQKFGFVYSEYRFEHHQKGLNEKELPKAFFLKENGEMEIFGSTTLKEGELKNAIKHRKVTIAKFLDNDSEWHCFYYNYNSINGKESTEIPHIHYISNNWTLKRETVLEELRKRHHSFTSSVHINYKKV